jgi:hypothetical protein
MRIILSTIAFAFFALVAFAQESTNTYQNKADEMLATDGKLTIGGYGQINYNQRLDPDKRYNGQLDVTRLVMLFGYNFSDKTQFITEIEYEHVTELYVEQAFVQHQLAPWLNVRGGLLLIPMGIINEYHEPTTFSGTERPFIDNVIAPTTWREIGAGFTGNVLPASLKYQLYMVTGFNGYSGGAAKLNGTSGFRGGRQKGERSYISSPNLATKVEYYGIRGLNLGLSGYFGDTQSTLYNNIEKDSDAAINKADSSAVNMAMVGFDARYQLGALQLRGQFYYIDIDNSDAYNKFTAVNGKPNDLGSAMQGFYIEAAYNILKHTKCKTELTPFVRYEDWNTHQKTEGTLAANPAYNKDAILAGFGFKPAPGVVFKADMQWVKDQKADKAIKTFNAGIGVMF